MPRSKPLASLTPKEYELAVKGILDATGEGLPEYRSWHLHPVEGVDGEYVIDVLVTFSALGAKFTVFVECKHEARRSEREDVQTLKDKVASAGAQKGMLFSLSGFQSGAIAYADVHGIALIQLADGMSMWHTRSAGPTTPPSSWVSLPKYVGWWQHGNMFTALTPENPEYIRQALGLPSAA
jgi:restriction system protein